MTAHVWAHLIVGPRDEPFLGALLESLTGVAQVLVVNDNAPDPSPHHQTLRSSPFGRDGRILLDRTPFVDFSHARNRCLELHRAHGGPPWAAFVDSDEVHAPAAQRVADRLHLVPGDVDFVDGYTWHFFASFDLYTSIERRMMFFRVHPDLHWVGTVHEQLHGSVGRRLALPYVYGHYGHALPVRRHAEKEHHYRALGHEVYRNPAYAGILVPQEQLDEIDVASYFHAKWPFALRFGARHPAAAQATIALLRAQYAADYARAEALARAAQPPLVRARNALLRLNYEQRWRSRALDPRARRLLSGRLT
ncbi:MAG TPA: hypothetical protein VME66_06065 [Candidatus Acidoferrales bacterium]|nr:hypothetical protein [Candidatus Acidoferrales bacterium]